MQGDGDGSVLVEHFAMESEKMDHGFLVLMKKLVVFVPGFLKLFQRL